MNWLPIGNILLGIGAFAVLVGLLLRFQVGRWLLIALLLLLTLVALMNGESADTPDTDDPIKTSGYWLLGGGISLLVGLALRTLASKTI
ncbi:hypothetical protein [Hymenobacter sp. IS2118]|uniref:hypothetical protein n=1 Tax=Hymenobacter sp. IS2118 TaxID=1505605 RepID=UPI0005500D25|nr:hypothetical protein [Hymenobacter sp. IS2118]